MDLKRELCLAGMQSESPSTIPIERAAFSIFPIDSGYLWIMRLLRKATTIACLLMAGDASAQTLDDLEFGTPASLDLATWNIEWFPKNGTTTIEAVQTIIENLEIDLWGIQEIDDTTAFKNMVDGIAGYEYILMDGWFGGLVYVYNASQIEVMDVFEIYTESPFWSPLPRSPLVLHFRFNGEAFYAFNNHFKCCGNGTIDWSDSGDEEMRRREACVLIQDYIEANLAGERVIVLGDLNDLIEEASPNNVFEPFLDLPDQYLFADMPIAEGPIANWSFPGWPSHLDHILISNELFSDFAAPTTEVVSLDIASYLSGGWSEYDNNISDHRPVAMSIVVTPLDIDADLIPSTEAQLVFITDMMGRACSYAPHQVLLYHFTDGSVKKVMSGGLQSPF
jgi:endonuclease/exonuclease/phosphatase family metal-dependent hydrolase